MQIPRKLLKSKLWFCTFSAFFRHEFNARVSPNKSECLETMVKKNRRALRSNKKNNVSKCVKFVGINSAGLTSKLESFDVLLSNLGPSVFFLQETKFRMNGKVKTTNSANYHIYELVRKNRAGGGIAIGVEKLLDPAWINVGKEGVELLTVGINLSGFKVRCVCGYGPQENDSSELKNNFWTQLGLEVDDALDNETGLIIEMDGNLWAGPQLIPGDPNEINRKVVQEILGKIFSPHSS